MSTEVVDRSNILAGQTVFLKKISEISIKPRQRKIDVRDKNFLEHIDRLAASIQRVGLIHPVTLEDEGDELVTGFCRLNAFLKMGKETIPCVRRGDLSDLDKKIMELEENLERLDLEWWMKDAAIAEIHKLQSEIAIARGETWTQTKTAEATSTSVGRVNAALQVTEAIKKNPELKKASGLVAALKQIETEKKMEKRKEDIKLREAGLVKTYPAEIQVGDALELIKTLPEQSFDAVVTNFPFGVDLTLGDEHAKPYHDEEDYIVKLVRSVTHECYRVLRNDSWMLAFFDVRKISYSNKQRMLYNRHATLVQRLVKLGQIDADEAIEHMELASEAMGLTFWMEEAGFKYVQLMPCIWAKPNKTQGMIGDPNKGFIVAYEAFVLAGKGSPILLKKGLQNIFLFDTPTGNERDLSVQMPRALCSHLINMVTLGGGRVLDPFAGSGAIGEGALDNNCSYLGFENSIERAEVGNLRLREHLYAKQQVEK